jgi:hypothetical protein
MTRAERLHSKLKDVVGVRVVPVEDELIVALVFCGPNKEQLGNVGLHIGDALNIGKGLLMCAIAAVNTKAADELVKRVKGEAVAKDGRGKTRGSKSVARRAGNKKPTTRSTPILSSYRAEPSK